MNSKFVSLIILPSLIGCATETKSTVLGAGIGLVTGGLMGAAVGQNQDDSGKQRSVMIGAAVGGIGGALLGKYAHETQEEKKQQEINIELKSTKQESPIPGLNKPEVRKVWVPDKIDGNKYEQGHFIFIIERPTSWTK